MPGSLEMLDSLRKKITTTPKIVDIGRDLGLGQGGMHMPITKIMLTTLAMGYLMKKMIDKTSVPDGEELTEQLERLYYYR